MSGILSYLILAAIGGFYFSICYISALFLLPAFIFIKRHSGKLLVILGFLVGFSFFHLWWWHLEVFEQSNAVILRCSKDKNKLTAITRTGIKTFKADFCISSMMKVNLSNSVDYKNVYHHKSRVHPVKSMYTGQRPFLRTELMFRRLGLSHVFAVSGLHVGVLSALAMLVSGLIFNILNKIKRFQKKTITVVTVLPLIWIYVFYTGKAWGSIRAGIMSSLFIIFKKSLGYGTIGEFYFVALGTVFFISPWSLMLPGVQLSFAAVGIIILVMGVSGDNKMKYLLVCSGASITSTLIVFVHFNTVSPMSLWVNIVFLPVFTAVFIPVSIVLAPFSYWLPLPMELLKAFYNQFEKIPNWILWKTENISMDYGFLLWLFSVVSVSISSCFRGVIRIRLLVISFLAFVVIAINLSNGKNEETLITFYASNHGESILLKRGNISLLIDPGNKKAGYDLMQKGVTTLDAVFITHYHSDHYRDFLWYCQNFYIKNVFDNGELDDRENIRKECPSVNFRHGNGFLKFGRISIEAFSPVSKNSYSSSLFSTNNSSMVLLIRVTDKTILLMGDIKIEGEGEFLKIYPELKVDLLKSGHHGRKSSLGRVFRNRVKWKTRVILNNPDKPQGIQQEKTKEGMDIFIKRDKLLFRM
ncbi:MAG: ComEC/Rec2 family competence protein [Deltaproteobacteria bacterium]|nr:ComEC/Rec2 family competence protein [Deltaproteobacteria bacterium]